MHYLIYVSTAKKTMTDHELLDLLTVSRNNNAKFDITGMLLYSGGAYMQVLEGPFVAINDSYAIIEKDTRHKNLIKFIVAQSAERTFPGWSMAFATVNADKLSQLKGYIDPASKNFLKQDNPDTIITILKTFAETNGLIEK
jgi:hypothetical protein